MTSTQSSSSLCLVIDEWHSVHAFGTPYELPRVWFQYFPALCLPSRRSKLAKVCRLKMHRQCSYNRKVVVASQVDSHACSLSVAADTQLLGTQTSARGKTAQISEHLGSLYHKPAMQWIHHRQMAHRPTQWPVRLGWLARGGNNPSGPILRAECTLTRRSRL